MLNLQVPCGRKQEEAVNKIDKNKLGMLCAHTGFGKTVVGCALIARRKSKDIDYCVYC